jgi:hypothetical protein
MRVLKLICILLMSMLLSAAFLACSKSEDIRHDVSGSQSPVTDPAAGNESTAIAGLWSGSYFGVEKSIPVYLSFNIKSKEKLEVLDAQKSQIGSGAWTLNNNNFKAVYTIWTSKKIYFFAGLLSDSPARLIGTWGYSASSCDKGEWDMIKKM